MLHPHGPLHPPPGGNPYPHEAMMMMTDPRFGVATAGRGVVARRAVPIPRPWLSEHHHVRHHITHPDENNDSLDLLQPTEWKVSWSKLSCCWFCGKEGESSSSRNKKDARRRTSYDRDVPFPAFPILRRNSSSSLLVNENDVYAVRTI